MVRVSGSIYGNDVVAWREEQRERQSVRGLAKALEVGGELQDALEVLRVPRVLPLKSPSSKSSSSLCRRPPRSARSCQRSTLVTPVQYVKACKGKEDCNDDDSPHPWR